MASMMDHLTGKASKKEKDNYVLNAKLNRFWDKASGARKELDWKWFQYDLWVSGNHFAKWDKNTQQIVTSPRMDGKYKVVVNKIYSTLRGVRSWVLQNQPKADVTPYNLTEDSIDTVAKLNQYLIYLHNKLRLRMKLRSSMWHALKYSVGYWQILFNEEAKEIEVNVVDPYDIYWDEAARFPEEARYVVLCVRRSLDDLKEDPKYKDADWDGVEADNLLSSSPLKARILQFEKGSAPTKGDYKSDGTVIVKETWYKEYDEKTQTHKIMLCTKANDKIIRGPIDTELTRFPFFTLHSDVEPLSIYGTGWVKNLIPLNRLLNRLESSSAEYNDIVNKMRLKVEKGAGIRTVNNEHGSWVEHKKGFGVEFLPVPPLSAQLQHQITNVNRYVEDIGSLHDASLGRVPSGVKSGVGVEALQEGDSNNLSELTENVEIFLEEVYEYILFLASQNYQFARDIVTTTTAGEKEFITLIGENTGEDVRPDNATIIPKKATVDVKITSWLAYTQEGRRLAVKDLVSLIPDLPPEFILEAYQTGNIADIVRKIKEVQLQRSEQEAAAQEQQARTQGQVQLEQQQQQAQAAGQQQLNQGAGAEAAIALIKAVLSGQRPQMPPAVNPDFVAYLEQFIAEETESGNLAGEDLAVLEEYRDQALMMVRQGAPVTN